jgi:poly(3-hydroxybutyrate) depolymerase
MLEKIGNQFCVDLNSVHMTGISNGGMFSYYAVSRLK